MNPAASGAIGSLAMQIYFRTVNRLALLCVLSFGIPIASATSFDCADARTNIEKLICSDAGLSKLDGDLNKAYLLHLESNAHSKQATSSQRQWLKNIRDVCKDVRCISEAYKSRIRELVLSRLAGKNNILKPHFNNPDESANQIILGKWIGFSKAFQGFDFEVTEHSVTFPINDWPATYTILAFEQGTEPSQTQPLMKGKWDKVAIWIDSPIYEVLVFTIRQGSECAAGISLYGNVEDYILNPDLGGSGWGSWTKENCVNRQPN